MLDVLCYDVNPFFPSWLLKKVTAVNCKLPFRLFYWLFYWKHFKIWISKMKAFFETTKGVQKKSVLRWIGKEMEKNTKKQLYQIIARFIHFSAAEWMPFWFANKLLQDAVSLAKELPHIHLSVSRFINCIFTLCFRSTYHELLLHPE